MGQLKIVTGGLKLQGKAFVLDSLIASTIRSRTGQPIVIESSKNLTLSTRNENGFRDNKIFLGKCLIFFLVTLMSIIQKLVKVTVKAFVKYKFERHMRS